MLTAVASYLDIRSQNGDWLLRVDDLDEQRGSRSTALYILDVLERHGLASDRACVWQSDRKQMYAQALETLRRHKWVFECTCSRKQLAGEQLYPGTCRDAGIVPGTGRSTRFVAPDAEMHIRDDVQGKYSQNLATDCGDFVVYRRDGVAAYHLATVLDDADMGVTRVVRGADLLDSTPRQVALSQALGLPTPSFAHIPVLLDPEGRKSSKSLSSTPVDALTDFDVKCNLHWCLQLLGLSTPPIRAHSVESLLHWAAQRFDISAMPSQPVRSDFVCL